MIKLIDEKFVGAVERLLQEKNTRILSMEVLKLIEDFAVDLSRLSNSDESTQSKLRALGLATIELESLLYRSPKPMAGEKPNRCYSYSAFISTWL